LKGEKGMFGNLFKKKAVEVTAAGIIVAQLNARLQPTHRHELEDAWEEISKKYSLPPICGGGTKIDPNTGEVEFCDLEFSVSDFSDKTIEQIKGTLEAMGTPKGSILHIHDEPVRRIDFGTQEGIAVYLNGTDLPDETYRDGDSNFVYEEFNRLLGDEGAILSHWQGDSETALYMYGKSFSTMKTLLMPFIDSFPLCAKARVVQIA
jgi:hypothetical protein